MAINKVLDSSVIVKWVSSDNENYLDKANTILKDAEKGKINLIAPELAKYEIGNALLKKSLPTEQAYHSLSIIANLPIRYVPETEDLAMETYKMAQEARLSGNPKFTYYDAAFNALAKSESAELITDNPKHQTKIKGVKVIALKDY